jgi:hypothetical protein
VGQLHFAASAADAAGRATVAASAAFQSEHGTQKEGTCSQEYFVYTSDVSQYKHSYDSNFVSKSISRDKTKVDMLVGG